MGSNGGERILPVAALWLNVPESRIFPKTANFFGVGGIVVVNARGGFPRRKGRWLRTQNTEALGLDPKGRIELAAVVGAYIKDANMRPAALQTAANRSTARNPAATETAMGPKRGIAALLLRQTKSSCVARRNGNRDDVASSREYVSSLRSDRGS